MINKYTILVNPVMLGYIQKNDSDAYFTQLEYTRISY